MHSFVFVFCLFDCFMLLCVVFVLLFFCLFVFLCVGQRHIHITHASRMFWTISIDRNCYRDEIELNTSITRTIPETFLLVTISLTSPSPPVFTHYSDVIIGAMESQIISLTIVYLTVYSGADQRKHQSSASLAFVRGIHRWPVNSPHKWSATRKMFPFDDVIMGTKVLFLALVFQAIYNLFGDFNQNSISHEKHHCMKLMTNHKNIIEIISMEISPRHLITYSKEAKQKRVVCMQCSETVFTSLFSWHKFFITWTKCSVIWCTTGTKPTTPCTHIIWKPVLLQWNHQSDINLFALFVSFYCFSVYRFHSVTMTTLFSIRSRFPGKRNFQVVPSINSFIIHVTHIDGLMQEWRNSIALAMVTQWGCVFLTITNRYDKYRWHLKWPKSGPKWIPAKRRFYAWYFGPNPFPAYILISTCQIAAETTKRIFFKP